MAKMTWLERRYRRSRLDYVRHITIDPRGPGVVRIHMIPPRTEDPADPFLLSFGLKFSKLLFRLLKHVLKNFR